MQQYEFLPINILVFKIDYRHRIKLGLYLFTNFFSVTFCISKPQHLVIIADTEYQYSAFTIGKGGNTFEPALRPSDLKHLFLIVSCRFAYQ